MADDSDDELSFWERVEKVRKEGAEQREHERSKLKNDINHSSKPSEEQALAALALISESSDIEQIISDSSSSSEFATEVALTLAEEWESTIPDERIRDASTIDDLVNPDNSIGAKQVAKVECPNCGSRVYAYRDRKGRLLITTTGGLVLASVGAGIGSIVGIATGGWGTVATVPFGAAGAVIGSGLGYILGDSIDKPRCPKCEEPIHLGI